MRKTVNNINKNWLINKKNLSIIKDNNKSRNNKERKNSLIKFLDLIHKKMKQKIKSNKFKFEY